MGLKKASRFNYNSYPAHTSGSADTSSVENAQMIPREQYDCANKDDTCDSSYTIDDWHCNGCKLQGHELSKK